jgi:hypothetical protein
MSWWSRGVVWHEGRLASSKYLCFQDILLHTIIQAVSGSHGSFFSFIFLSSSANLVVYHLSMPLATPCPTILLLVEVRVSHDLYVNCLIIILYSLMFAYIKKSFYFRASQTYFFSCHIMSKVCHSYVLSPDHSIM